MSSKDSADEKGGQQSGVHDLESQGDGLKKHHGLQDILHVEKGEVYEVHPEKNAKWYQRLLDVGIEENGVKPVPIELRVNKQYNQIFTVFFTCLLCLLPIPTGALATYIFGLSLRDASLVILFFATLTSIPPAVMGLGGYKTGLRQMIQARYSFGLYLVVIPLLLNASTITGFSLISAIVGGQTIAAVNPSANISVNVGIVIVCIISYAVSLLGYNVLHQWERYQWIPNIIAILITVGCGGKHLHKQYDPPPPTAAQVLSYGGLMAGYFITFGGTVSDYSTYHHPDGKKRKVFAYILSALVTPSVPLLVLGAAIGGAIPNVPEWKDAYELYGIGGVVAEMLSPAKGFGKFVLVVLALSVIGNITISVYSVALCLQTITPLFAKVHRFVWVTITMAVMIPMAIRSAEEWERSLENFLALIGYWAGCFDAVLLEELLVFRRMDWSTYDHAIWNDGKRLPPGIAALSASILSFSLVVPGMATAWFTGPIAKTTGDIGFEMAFVLTGIFYLPLRWLEIRHFPVPSSPNCSSLTGNIRSMCPQHDLQFGGWSTSPPPRE